jgi:ketosteroid isomerase-like protein
LSSQDETLEAFLHSEGRDWEELLAFLHPDVEWVIAREHPQARTLTGREAVAQYRREWEEMLPGARFERERLLTADDRVLAIGTIHGAGAASGAEVAVPLALLLTTSGGLIVRVQEFLDPAEALESAGLAEGEQGAGG